MDDRSLPIAISLSSDAVLPSYETGGSAGMDLRITEEVELEPGEIKLAKTGLKIAVPLGYEAQVRPRSGLALKLGISMVNTPGTIDSDFRGEIGIILINHGQKAVKLAKGERAAQLVICPVMRADWKIVEELDTTDRGDGGFGSTGTA